MALSSLYSSFQRKDESEETVKDEHFFVSEEKQDLPDTSLEEEDSVWNHITRWTIYLIAFLTPFWFLPLTITPLEANKLFIVSILAIVGFIAWLGRAIYGGGIRLPKSNVLLAMVIWLGMYLLASLFSISPDTSFWEPTVRSFFSILIFSLIAFLTAVSLEAKDIRRVYSFLLVAGTIVGVFTLLRSVFNIQILPWDFANSRTFNLVGSWNVLGIFFGFLLVTIAPMLEDSLPRKTKIFLGSLAATALLLAALVNFIFVWIGIGIISILFLAYYLSRSSNRKAIGMPLILLLISVLFFLSRAQIDVFVSGFNAPLDVTPSFSTTMKLTGEVLKESPIFGYGPNTFGQVWDLYKDPSINDTIFWSLRFETGSASATSLFVTTGLLGSIAFLAFLVLVIWYGLTLLGKLPDEGSPMKKSIVVGTFLGTIFLLYAWFIYPLNSTITILTFLSIGLMIAEGRSIGLVKDRKISIVANSSKGFVVALFVIFLMVFGVVGIYITGQKYIASVFYGRGLTQFNVDGAVNAAEESFRRAVTFDSSRDDYLRASAQISFVKLQRSIQNSESLPAEDVRSAFQLALSNAISSAQAATNVNSKDAANWRVLGQVYEVVIPFVDGASDAALTAYGEAIKRSPLDPTLRDDLARVYMELGDHLQARESLQKAIELKRDYATAHFRLAQIAAIKGNVSEAIGNTERAALSAPNDVGILFQLGLLYYQEERYVDAEQILSRAVRLSTNFSNARYFLGLTQSELGNKAGALEQFQRIAELNPGNGEVAIILENLEADRKPLTGISPPGPGPLEREKPPLEEESESSNSDLSEEE